MGKRKSIIISLVFLFISGTAIGQDSNLYFNIESWGGYTTPDHVPFWLRSNKYGSIPLDCASLSLIGSARKDYGLSKDKLFDWGASFEGRANLGQGSNLILVEGYGKVRLSIFEFRAGRSKEIMGLCDTTLSSGSWAISGTNLGIPEVEVSVPEFFIIPGLGQLFAFKGNFSHGWMGDASMNQYWEPDTVEVETYFHQASLYGRFGKPSWKMKLYGGFNHQAVWCNGEDYYNDDFTLSFFQTFLYVITGKRYSNGSIQSERLGNHAGSIDIGFEYEFDGVKLFLYRQNFYDAGALAHLANIQDGLNGISIMNIQNTYKTLMWKKFLFEFLYTKNQAGEPWSPPTPTYFENYYNHGQFINGWSCQNTGLGSPFMTVRTDAREGLPAHPRDYFINNRVLAIHFGYEGSVKNLNYIVKGSWSKNYGTYRTIDEEQSTGITDPGAYGIFGEQKQFSAYLELSKTFSNKLNLGLIGALDIGDLYYNSSGLFLKASYSFTL